MPFIGDATWWCKVTNYTTAAPLTTGNEFLFHCYLFPVPIPHTQKTAGRAQKKTERPTKIGTHQTQNDCKNYGNAPETEGKTHRKRQEAQDFSASAGLPWEQGRLPDGGAAQKSGKVRNPEGGGLYITPGEHCMPIVYTCFWEDITGGT